MLPSLAPFQEELGYLKSMWDMVAAVLHTFQAWSSMLWGSINVESLQEVRMGMVWGLSTALGMACTWQRWFGPGCMQMCAH